MTGPLALFTNFSIGAIVFLTGVLSALWTNAMQQADGMVNEILGPTGALAFAIVSLGFIVKYLLRQQKRLEDSTDARIKDRDRTIEKLEKQIETLISQIGK